MSHLSLTYERKYRILFLLLVQLYLENFVPVA